MLKVRLCIVFAALALFFASCSSDSNNVNSGDPLDTERRLPVRSWAHPAEIPLLTDSKYGSKVISHLSERDGKLMLLTSASIDILSRPAWHNRLFVLSFDGLEWTVEGHVPGVGAMNTASGGYGRSGDKFIFWAADPPDLRPPDDAGFSTFTTSTGIFACKWRRGECSVRDSIIFGKRWDVMFSDVLLTDSDAGRVLSSHAQQVRDMEMSDAGLQVSLAWNGIWPNLVKSRNGVLSAAGGRKLETTTGFRLYAQRSEGGIWSGSRTVYETAGESVQMSNLLIDSSGTAHVVFWAFPPTPEATLYHSMSMDEGISWSDAVPIDSIPRGFPINRPQLAEDMNGVLHLVWGVAPGFGQSDWYESLYHRGDWSEPAEWTVGETGFKWRVHVIAGGDGRLHAAWYSDDKMYYSVYE